MGQHVGFILGYSPIQQIIQRSKMWPALSGYSIVLNENTGYFWLLYETRAYVLALDALSI